VSSGLGLNPGPQNRRRACMIAWGPRPPTLGMP
jgi:hypothetical protein